jgi:site-specific DNA-cytosine methylase
MNELRAIDVCSGAGGWAVAARGLPIKIVAAFDREHDALATYKLNHPAVETVECNIVENDFSRWHGIDLILGGIPCEQVSAYRTMHKTKNSEINELECLLARCLSLPEELGAPWWCYEDVTQIQRHLLLAKGFTLNSERYSAQRRARHFVGNLPMPPAGDCNALLRDALRPGPYRIGQRLRGRVPQRNNAFKPTSFYPWEPDRKSPPVITLTSRRDAEAATRFKEHWRQLEWQELATLQGFPADYIFVGSPSRVTKMIAQAVQVETGRAILKALLAHIEGYRVPGRATAVGEARREAHLKLV